MEYTHYILKAIKSEYECSIIANNLAIDICNELKDYLFDYLNEDGFISLNEKDFKAFGFRGFDDYYNLGTIELLSVNVSSLEFIIKLIRTNDEINPFSLINSNVFDNPKLKINYGYKVTQNDISNYLNKDNEYIVKCLIDSIINKDGNIYIHSDFKELLFWYELIGLLLPRKYLYDISFIYSLDYFNFNKLKIAYGIKNANEEIFDFDDKYKRYDIEISKYSEMIIECLNDSLKEAIVFKDKIDSIMQNNNLSLDECVDVYNLIMGKINLFPNVAMLSRAIELANNINYDKKLVSSIIFPSLGKYEICNDILVIYELLYDNLAISRDYIINQYFDSLAIFGISGYKSHDEYLNLVDSNCPFPLVDYYDYLKKYDLFAKYLNNSYDDFYMGYLLLELECRSIKDDKAIVPNETFLYFINACIIKNDIARLDIILKRISLVNKKAPARLLDIEMSKISRGYRNVLEAFDIKLLFLLCERLMISYAKGYLVKAYNCILDRREFIDMYLDREAKNPSFYEKLNDYFKDKPELKLFIDSKEQKAVYVNKELSYDDLKEIYKNIYLDKTKPVNDVFFTKVLEYLDSLGLDMKLDACVNIFNDFYKPLPYTYKDRLDSIRKLNDYVYRYPELLIKYDRRYFRFLYELNEILSKAKSSVNPYYMVVRRGLEYKDACQNESSRRMVFEAIRVIPYFNSYTADMINYFVKYQINSYIEAFFEYLPKIQNINENNYYEFLECYRLYIDPICEYKGFGHAFRDSLDRLDSNNKKRQLFLYLLMALASNRIRYIKIVDRIIADIDKKELKIIFSDYQKILNCCPFKGKKEAILLEKYIADYLKSLKFSIKKLFKKA